MSHGRRRRVAQLRQKVAQAREVIAHLMDKAAFNGAEAHRALDISAATHSSRIFCRGRAMAMRACGRRS